jgi:hypothetical protein
MSNVHPEILDGLEFESQFIQNTSGSQRRDVKLQRGDAWLLRFLPVKLGAQKRWYARIAKHWLNKKMVFCPRNTEEAYGGSPDAYCPVCELSQHLNDDTNEAVRDFGFSIRGGAQWTTWCVVFEKSIKGGPAQVMPTPEVLQPYTFNHYRSTWEELTAFLRQGLKRAPNSVLDLEKGNDFYAAKGAKGVRLDKQDSAPIFQIDDPNWDANIEKIFAACKAPIVKMPDDKTLETFAAKAEEEADNLSKPARRAAAGPAPRRGNAEGDDLPPDEDQTEAPRGRGRQVVEEDNVPMDYPPRRAAAPAEPVDTAPRRRSTAPPQDEQQGSEPPPRRSATPAAEAPPRRTAAPVAAPARRAAAPPPEPEQDPADVAADEAAAEGDGEGNVDIPNDVEPEAPRATATSRPSSRGAATAPPAAPARRTAAPAAAAAPARNSRGGGAPAAESLDEEENIPEEAKDQAPPEPLTDDADPGAAEEPPQVDRRGANLGSSIKNRIAAVSASAKK